MYKRLFLVALLAAIATGVAAHGSITRRTIASTGLFSLTRGHVAILTVADVGLDRNASAPVRLQILNARNEVIAEQQGTLGPGRPLTLRTDAAHITDVRVPVRARVQVVNRRFGRRRAPTPILTFEFLNEDTLDIQVGVSCPIPAAEPGGRGPEFDCPPPCEINVI